MGIDREGPMEVVIPEQRFLSCSGCKYLEHNMIRSGRDPAYTSTCKHETAPKSGWNGNLWERILNRGSITPGEWCPFKFKIGTNE